MSSTYVDPWLAGKANLAEAKSRGKVAAITAKAEAEARREERKEQRADKRRTNRGKAATAVWAWAKASWFEVLWLPVIVAPAVLAWQGQTAAGNAVYGDATGWLLALFTETAAWVVAFYVEAARRANPGMPVGRGRAAVWLVALAAAGMNYLHGAQTDWWHGVVMAVVSIGGIALHQVAHGLRSRSESGISGVELRARAARWLLHPLWSVRAASIAAARGVDHGQVFAALWLDHWGTDAVGRRERRRARAARDRVADLERAAARSATAWLCPDGRVELRYPEGPVTLHRRTLTTTRGVSVADELARLLAASPVSGRVVPLWAGTGRTRARTGVAPAGNSANAPEPARNSANTPRTTGNSANDAVPGLVRQVRAAIAAGQVSARPSRREVQKHLRVRAELAQAVKAALDGNSTNTAGAA